MGKKRMRPIRLALLVVVIGFLAVSLFQSLKGRYDGGFDFNLRIFGARNRVQVAEDGGRLLTDKIVTVPFRSGDGATQYLDVRASSSSLKITDSSHQPVFSMPLDQAGSIVATSDDRGAGAKTRVTGFMDPTHKNKKTILMVITPEDAGVGQ